MEVLNFRNKSVQNSLPEVQKRLASEENFTALDSEKLKEDTVELTSKVKDNASENFIFRTLRNFGVSDPKKTLKSLGLSIATVIGVAILGNKLSTPAAKLGNKLDDFLTGDNVIGKFRNGIVNFLKDTGKNIAEKMPKPKFVVNIAQALKNPLQPKANARGLVNGAKGIFSNTITETIAAAVEKNKDEAVATLSKVLGDNKEKAEEIIKDVMESKLPSVQIADRLLNEIAVANNCVENTTKLTQVLENLSKGKIYGNGLRGIAMTKGGFFASWWPANAINSLLKKYTNKESHYLMGNLGDSLIKYGAVRGKLAKTLPAKIIQIIPPLTGDQISNFVNDKAGFGVLLCASLVGNYNKLQDAPKEKKATTALNDVATGSLSWLAGMPITCSIVYGLASLSKTEGKDIISSLARNIGNVFALGMDKGKGVPKGFLGNLAQKIGGFGRFALFMFVVSPFVTKKIEALVSKIFGKPYDPVEEQKAKKLEEQMNTVVPELGITQGELQERIKKNPQAIKNLQSNSELIKAIDKNPKLMLDLLDGKEINQKDTSLNSQAPVQSQMLQSTIKNGKAPVSNKSELFSSKKKEKNEQKEENIMEDTATYIPNSAFIAPKEELSPQVQQEYNRILENADRAILDAQKYI